MWPALKEIEEYREDCRDGGLPDVKFAHQAIDALLEELAEARRAIASAEPAPTCQRDCQKCESAKPAAPTQPIYACAGCGATDWEIVEVGRNCNKCAGDEECGGYDADPHLDETEAAAGGTGVGLQGEEGGGRGE